MDAKHTPGPWRDGPLFGRETRGIFYTDDSKPGRWQRRLDNKGEFSAADARLVAAAPDLLEALQGVLRVADRATDEFDAARAAIAKAMGHATP